jgi:uncharacterized membrane protein
MSQVLTSDAVLTSTAPAGAAARKLFLLAAVVILAAATGLRVYHLRERSLWYDEAVTALASRGTLPEVMEKTRHYSAPVVHPYLLYVAEHIGHGATAARAPSAIASILVVLVMLAMNRTGVGYTAALFSSAIIAFSASQIRYAQEVREYSFAVLVAALFVYAFLRLEAMPAAEHSPWLLYSLFFLAPLVQYGLVFFASGVLAAILILVALRRKPGFTFGELVGAAVFLAAGALLSFFLTLRYQFHSGSTPWYLAESYFDPRRGSLFQFLKVNSSALLSFLIPGRVVDILLVLAVLVSCVRQAIKRTLHPAVLLAFTTLTIHIAASIARLYPYGGVRQCLFLAPPIALLAGVAFAHITGLLRGTLRTATNAALLLVIILSLCRGMRFQSPYEEYEDTKAILRQLATSVGPGDRVWVNHDAVDAFRFYQAQGDSRFTYGVYRSKLNDYPKDVYASIDPDTQRIWLVFSHLQQPSDRTEEQWIVNSLRPSWDVRRVISPTNAELFVADRRVAQ